MKTAFLGTPSFDQAGVGRAGPPSSSTPVPARDVPDRELPDQLVSAALPPVLPSMFAHGPGRSIAGSHNLVDASFLQRHSTDNASSTGRQPDPASWKPPPDDAPAKALARAWQSQRMLDDGVYASVSEIGDAEKIGKSYVSRILRLAMLAPDMVEPILAGRMNQALMLERLERPLPSSWEEPRQMIGHFEH